MRNILLLVLKHTELRKGRSSFSFQKIFFVDIIVLTTVIKGLKNQEITIVMSRNLHLFAQLSF